MNDYHIAHYLEAAAELQQLDPDRRATRLAELAKDAKRGSEVFVLCRMLFEAKPDGKFERPGIGQPIFVGGGEVADWPLEPITLAGDVPILVCKGYLLAGVAEEPESYVDYCLKDCKWRDAKYKKLGPEERKAVVEGFITVNLKLNADADFLRAQAK